MRTETDGERSEGKKKIVYVWACMDCGLVLGAQEKERRVAVLLSVKPGEGKKILIAQLCGGVIRLVTTENYDQRCP